MFRRIRRVLALFVRVLVVGGAAALGVRVRPEPPPPTYLAQRDERLPKR